MIHDLKSPPGEFRALWKGKAAAIVRRTASGIAPGSVVRLREYDADFARFSGRTVKALVKHACEPAGLREGFALLSLRVTHRHRPDVAKARRCVCPSGGP